jgi:hypothetical protein
MPVVTSDQRNDPVVRLVERSEVGLDLHVEGAVDAGGFRLMRFVGHDLGVEQRTLYPVGPLQVEKPPDAIDAKISRAVVSR